MLEKITEGDFQKLLHIGLQSLAIQKTLLENQVAELNKEMRTLERDDELEKLDHSILLISKDYDHYKAMIDPEIKIELDSYYDWLKSLLILNC